LSEGLVDPKILFSVGWITGLKWQLCEMQLCIEFWHANSWFGLDTGSTSSPGSRLGWANSMKIDPRTTLRV